MKFNKRIKFLGWFLFFILLVCLMFWAGSRRKESVCQGIKVEIEGENRAVFIDEAAVKQTLKAQNVVINGRQIDSIDLHILESDILVNPWIQSAKLFFDNNGFLVAKIREAEPVARVFTISGNSFYVDTLNQLLPDGYGVSLKLPVFTSFTSDSRKLSPPDSILLSEVVTIGKYLVKDSFWNAFVTSVNINTNKDFELIPLIGKAPVIIGNADSLEPKFNRLFSFYKEVLSKTGYGRYEKIDVQFNNQVVATIKGGLVAQSKVTRSEMEALTPLVLKTSEPKDSGAAPLKKPILKKDKEPIKLKAVKKTKATLNQKINAKAAPIVKAKGAGKTKTVNAITPKAVKTKPKKTLSKKK